MDSAAIAMIGTSTEREKLREEIDKAYQKGLEDDRAKGKTPITVDDNSIHSMNDETDLPAVSTLIGISTEIGEETGEASGIAFEIDNKITKIRLKRKSGLNDQSMLHEEHTVITVKHARLGNISRLFSTDLYFDQVYKWIGSMEESPPYFVIKTQSSNKIYPSERICSKDLLYMDGVSQYEFFASIEDDSINLDKDSEISHIINHFM